LAAAAYDAKFCSRNPIAIPRTPEASVTCELARKAQQIFGAGAWGATAGDVRRFINQEIVPSDLRGRLSPASPWDLEALIPKPGPREITEFNVL
jgi:hypothetical protein